MTSDVILSKGLASNPGPHRHRICDRCEEANVEQIEVIWAWVRGYKGAGHKLGSGSYGCEGSYLGGEGLPLP